MLFYEQLSELRLSNKSELQFSPFLRQSHKNFNQAQHTYNNRGVTAEYIKTETLRRAIAILQYTSEEICHRS